MVYIYFYLPLYKKSIYGNLRKYIKINNINIYYKNV